MLTTNSDLFASMFKFMAVFILCLFTVSNTINVINGDSPFFDTNMRMAMGLTVFLYLCSLLCRFIGSKTNPKVYDPLYSYYIQNPKVVKLDSLFYDWAKGPLAIWVVAKDENEQHLVEEILSTMYQTDEKFRKRVAAEFNASMKRRASKDKMLKDDMLAMNPLLASYDFRLDTESYKNQPEARFFIYLKAKIGSKNFFKPEVDEFFEVDIRKL